MAVILKNYDDYSTGNPLGYTDAIPNPKNANNNSLNKYNLDGKTLNGVGSAPLLSFPVTPDLIQQSSLALLNGEGVGQNPILGSFSTILGGLQQLGGGGLGTFLDNIPILGDFIGNSPLSDATEGVAAGTIDTIRMSKFMNTPKGIKFTTNQVGLQLMNPKLENQEILGKSYTQLYTPLNTLTQIGLNSLSDSGKDPHISRAGLTPIMNDNTENNYFSVVQGKIFGNFGGTSELVKGEKLELGTNNRLVTLYNNHILNDGAGLGMVIDELSYSGGPNSLFGIGYTDFHRQEDTNSGKINSGSLIVAKISPSSSLFSSTNFNGGILPQHMFQNLDDDGNLSMEKRMGIGKISIRTDRTNLLKPELEAQDKINMSGLTDAVSLDHKPDNEDLVNFVFEAINNDSPLNSTFFQFRAYLTGISDKYDGEWNNGRYVGRGDKFYVYEGSTRSISFNFTVAAQTREEMTPIYEKLNYLASNLAPDYNKAGRMRAPFMKLTIGDYFVKLPGFISNLGYNVKDESPWDVALYKNADIDGFSEFEKQLPHMIDVSVSYTPIHNFLPRKGKDVKFIGI